MSATTYQTILLEQREPGIWLLTINRPKALNALSPQVLDEVAAATREVLADGPVSWGQALRAWAMAGMMVPPGRLAEFFGLWTFAIRLASILGPLSYGLITWATGGNHRLAIGSTALMFVLGLWLLRPVDVARGHQAAQAAH